MGPTDAQIRRRLKLGEDNDWEFKQVAFNGDRPVGPKREDLADEMTAFANASGGVLLLGVTDDGQIPGMSPAQMAALNSLVVEIATDSVKPPLRIVVRHRELDDRAFLLVQMPKGEAVHAHSGNAFVRVGGTKCRLNDDERLRLAEQRAQGRYLWYDKRIVPETGFGTLDEHLWAPLLSVTAAEDPRRGLMNLGLLAQDESGVDRATHAGILLCTAKPQDWLPHAVIVATYYRGMDRNSEQLDSQEITGPLPTQIADAVKFVVRNMRVAAHKAPAHENMPQYSSAAVFEAVVNAVAHRDYSMYARLTRLSMFKDRLEIDSPGPLPNGMTIEAMKDSQATRNEAIASVFGRIAVGDLAGTDHRRFLMERRGDGIAIILGKTHENAGERPKIKVMNESNLLVIIPAAKLDLVPADVTVTVHSEGVPLPGADVLALFPNKTWRRATTDEAGEATFDLYTTHLPMRVYAAAPGYAAGIKWAWRPDRGGLLLELEALPAGGAVIFPQSTGHLPGLDGRLNPIRDTSDRTYLYANNIAIDEGQQQPVPFRLGKPIRLTDAVGTELSVTVVDIMGRSSLLEYRPLEH